MERGLFYSVFFENINLFLVCILVMVSVNYLILHRFSIAGLMDPLHFYWTFTFGTAYGVVLALFLNGDINAYYFFMVFSYGLTFVVCSNYFLKRRVQPLNKFFVLISHIRSEPKILVFLIQLIFYIDLFIIIYFVGFGFLAEDNRFEQNRGMGAFIRVFIVLRLFLIAYYSLSLSKVFKTRRRHPLYFVSLSMLLLFFIVFTSLVDGAKFALLESILAVFVALALYGAKPKLGSAKLIVLVGASFLFAVVIYSINLDKQGLSDRRSSYVEGVPFVLEAISLRVLANADKYFLSLPNEVIEEVETKGVWVRLLAPIIGSSRLSNILGYNVNDYSIGKQVLLYWDPGFNISGGPTSHFDLFAYKQFGLMLGYLWVVLTAYILVGIKNLSHVSLKSKYSVSIAVVLWLRSWALLIEPPLGFAYILDVLVIFLFLILFNGLFKREVEKID